MGKYKPVLLLSIAVTIAFATSLATYNWLQKKALAQENPDLMTEEVVVAISDLSWGTVLKKEMFRTETFIKGSLPANTFFTDTSSLPGRVVLFPIQAGEPVFESRLAPESVTAGGVSALLSKSKRAMAVKVNKVIGVSGFIKPGNRVDVFVTLTRTGKTRTPVTKMVLQDVLVLAAGTSMEEKGKKEKPIPVDVITLEVEAEEAEKLALAMTEGKIQLALRGYTDTADVLTKGATIPALLASYRTAEERAAPAPRPQRKATHRPASREYTVWVINGQDVQAEKVKGGR